MSLAMEIYSAPFCGALVFSPQKPQSLHKKIAGIISDTRESLGTHKTYKSYKTYIKLLKVVAHDVKE